VAAGKHALPGGGRPGGSSNSLSAEAEAAASMLALSHVEEGTPTTAPASSPSATSRLWVVEDSLLSALTDATVQSRVAPTASSRAPAWVSTALQAARTEAAAALVRACADGWGRAMRDHLLKFLTPSPALKPAPAVATPLSSHLPAAMPTPLAGMSSFLLPPGSLHMHMHMPAPMPSPWHSPFSGSPTSRHTGGGLRGGSEHGGSVGGGARAFPPPTHDGSPSHSTGNGIGGSSLHNSAHRHGSSGAGSSVGGGATIAMSAEAAASPDAAAAAVDGGSSAPAPAAGGRRRAPVLRHLHLPPQVAALPPSLQPTPGSGHSTLLTGHGPGHHAGLDWTQSAWGSPHVQMTPAGFTAALPASSVSYPGGDMGVPIVPLHSTTAAAAAAAAASPSAGGSGDGASSRGWFTAPLASAASHSHAHGMHFFLPTPTAAHAPTAAARASAFGATAAPGSGDAFAALMAWQPASPFAGLLTPSLTSAGGGSAMTVTANGDGRARGGGLGDSPLLKALPQQQAGAGCVESVEKGDGGSAARALASAARVSDGVVVVERRVVMAWVAAVWGEWGQPGVPV